PDLAWERTPIIGEDLAFVRGMHHLVGDIKETFFAGHGSGRGWKVHLEDLDEDAETEESPHR
ncbi:unnamed protein product, partial [Amoebophrya sp. A25]